MITDSITWITSHHISWIGAHVFVTASLFKYTRRRGVVVTGVTRSTTVKNVEPTATDLNRQPAPMSRLWSDRAMGDTVWNLISLGSQWSWPGAGSWHVSPSKMSDKIFNQRYLSNGGLHGFSKHISRAPEPEHGYLVRSSVSPRGACCACRGL